MKEELSKYLEQNKTDEFKELLFSIIDKKQYKDSDVYKKARRSRRVLLFLFFLIYVILIYNQKEGIL